MPAPRPFQPVNTTIRKPRVKRPYPRLMTTVKDRLIREALDSPKYDHLDLEQISNQVEQDAMSQGLTNRLDYPWWWRALPKDAPKKPTTEAQREALAKARQRKAEIQAEADAPYVPASVYELLSEVSATPDPQEVPG